MGRTAGIRQRRLEGIAADDREQAGEHQPEAVRRGAKGWNTLQRHRRERLSADAFIMAAQVSSLSRGCIAGN